MNQSRFNFPLLVLVLILVVMVVCPLTAYSTGPQIAEIAVEHAQRPPSPADLVMMSRTTAPASDPHHTGGAGWFSIGLVVIAAAILLFKYGGEMLRQWRLVKGKRPTSMPNTPARPHYGIPQLPITRPAPRVPFLPDVFELDGGDHENHQ